MNKRSILLLSSLLLLSACGGQPQTSNNTTPTPQPAPVSSELSEKDNSSEAVTENNIASRSTPTSTTVSGLIPSTDPQERLKKVNQGKNDPFSSIRPPAVVKVTSDQELPLNTDSGLDAIVTDGDSQSGLDKFAKVTSDEASKSQGLSFDSTAANQILVSGILALQGENVAIIKTPWDSTTRSVRVGDVISDSTGNINVQVKKISFSAPSKIAFRDGNQVVLRDINNSGGTVVLEQYGQLITRAVAQRDNNESELEEL